MQATLERSAPARAAASLGAVAAVGALALFIGGGSGGALALALILAPIAFYCAVARPLIFPLGVYMLLVPFDNLLAVGSGATVTKLLGIAAGFCMLFWIARTRRIRAPDRSFAVLACFFCWACASALWAIDQQSAAAVLPTYAGLILLYGALCATRLTAGEFRGLVAFSIAGGVAAAVYGIVFYRQSWHATADPTRLVIQAGQNSIDPNHFANALLFPAAAILSAGLGSRRATVKACAAAGLAAIAAAILFSGSREALIGLGIVLLYQIFRSRYRAQAIGAAATIGIVALTLQSSLWERFGTAAATGGSGRSAIWSVAWQAAQHKWFAGYGIGTFPDVYDRFYLSVYQFYPNGWSSPAHNILLHYLVEVGVVGTLLLAAFFWLRFTSLRDIRPGDPLYGDRVMIESALLALIAVSFSIDLLTYKYAWLVLSMAALLRNAAPIRSEKTAMTAALR